MSSLIEGYTYDIFISYRQKDNKYDGWVTEFVDNLKRELEATFKEEISVYLDINPHDGLLETHDVSASLKEKLKCLVFIPVISQTYCDPISFAWKHEFAAFNKLSKEDNYGRDLRLAGGNVASRILPVKIHDLDQEDKTLLEDELGGVLRSIDFIYNSAGVNRPLKPSDNPDKNLNKTYYRDQINKVANAVKEIITAIKRNGQSEGQVSKNTVEKRIHPQNKLNSKILIGSFLLFLVAVLGYLYIPGLFKSSAPVEKTIAVLPFDNMSDDVEHSWFGDAMTDEIIMQLCKVNEFTVRSRNSVMQYKGTTKTSPEIGRELNVNYLIGGSAQRLNDQLKIRVQLINAVTDIPLWGDTFEGSWNEIINIQGEIARQIAEKLKTVLSPEEIRQIEKKPTVNIEAYNFYLLGNDYYLRSFDKQNIEIAARNYGKAIELDPDFALAYVRLAVCNLALHWFYYDNSIPRLEQSKEAIDAAFKIDPDLVQVHLALATYYYWGFLDYSKALEEIKITERVLKNNSECIYIKASIYRRAGEWSLAKENYLKAFELDPGSPRIILDLAGTCYLTGDFQEAEKYFNKVISINPTLFQAYWLKSLLYLKWKGSTKQARETIAEAFKFQECISNPILLELDAELDIYDGNYQKALSGLSLFNDDIIEGQYNTTTRSLQYARVYSLMGEREKAYRYSDTARLTLESEISENPQDDRLYIAVGFAYARLGLKQRAIEAGKRAVALMPISKEFYRGAYRIEDLSRIYVMTGEYDKALEQLKLLLSLPGPLSANLLQLDPDWKPLWNIPEFKKMINESSENVSRVN